MVNHDATLKAAQGWAGYFETMTEPADLDRLGEYCTADVRFKDPFNDVRGLQAMRRVFDHMFQTTVEPRFSVTSIAADGDHAFLHWRFTFKPKGREGDEPWLIDGTSIVTIDGEGRVSSHVDYWDAAEQLYEKLPVISFILRRIKKKLGSG